MAGDWIKMGTGLRTHPKVVRMASALKADGCPDRLRIIGALHAVWCLFDAHSEDGVLVGYTPEVVDEEIGWPGFTAALIAVGWCDVADESLVLPRFDAHNGQSAKRRAMEADRKRTVRKVSASRADELRTKEEKNREEKRNTAMSTKTSTDLLGDKASDPADLVARRAQRIATVTEDAISAYNAVLGKPVGKLPSVNAKVGRKKRQEQVQRCLQTASEICDDQFGDKRVTPQFWEAYFAACDADPWMRGDGPYTGGHANWKPDFEYLTRSATVLKVFERSTQEDAA